MIEIFAIFMLVLAAFKAPYIVLVSFLIPAIPFCIIIWRDAVFYKKNYGDWPWK